MTVEHRIVIGLEDIKAIILECNKCQARVQVPTANLDLGTHDECPSCKHQWWPSSRVRNAPATTQFSPFVLFVNGLKGILSQPQGVGFTMYLQLEEVRPSDASASSV
jgi:uncharacterized paraquat-inducible protein A